MVTKSVLEMVLPFLPKALELPAKSLLARLQALTEAGDAVQDSEKPGRPPISDQVFALLPTLLEVGQILVHEAIANPDRGARLFERFFSFLGAALALLEHLVVTEEQVDRVLVLASAFVVSLQEQHGDEVPKAVLSVIDHLEKAVRDLIEVATRR